MRVLTSLTGVEWATFLLSLAPKIWSDPDLEVFGFAHTWRWVCEGQALGLPRERILYIGEDRRARLREPVDWAYLHRMEAEYGLPNLWPFVLAEKFLWDADYEAIAKTLQVEFRMITEFLDRVRPNVLLLEAIGGVSVYIMWAWARRHGVRVVFPFTARLPRRFVVLDNPYDRWVGVERRFAEIRRRGLTPDERASAERLRRDITERHVQPSYVTKALFQFNPPALAADARHGLRYVRSYLRYRGWRDYVVRSPGYYAGEQLKKQARILAHRVLPVYERPRSGEPYVLFPLQIMPEASLMVWAPAFLDQVALVRVIAQSLPFGYRLYAKEHIAAWYARPLAFYRALREIPNVRVITPRAPAHPLVQGAAAVVTITSTMGWEGVVYGKPVVTLGRVFYNAFPAVRHVTALDRLGDVLWEAIKTYAPDDELLLLQFLAAVLARTYPGEIDAYMPGFLDPQNVETIAAGIRDELALWDAEAGTREPVARDAP